MDPKKPNLPLPSAGKKILWPFEDEYVKNQKNPKIFVKNYQNPLLFVLVGKEIVDYKNVVRFCFLQWKLKAITEKPHFLPKYIVLAEKDL